MEELRALAKTRFGGGGGHLENRTWPLKNWESMFLVQKGKWIWPETERNRALDWQAGWNTHQWYSLWHKSYLNEWVKGVGELKAATCWANITTSMRLIGWKAIEGCNSIWKTAKGLRVAAEKGDLTQRLRMGKNQGWEPSQTGHDESVRWKTSIGRICVFL